MVLSTVRRNSSGSSHGKAPMSTAVVKPDLTKPGLSRAWDFSVRKNYDLLTVDTDTTAQGRLGHIASVLQLHVLLKNSLDDPEIIYHLLS